MWCVVLMQGMAVSQRCTTDPDIDENTLPVRDIHVGLITRKSRINPGTRYTARGLNKEGGPGNECECELIMWTRDEKSYHIHWLSYVWRRGTVPVWWRTTLKSSVSGPDIEVRSEEPFQGCEKYYSRLLERYGPNEVILINTLRCDPEQKEVFLSEVRIYLFYYKKLENLIFFFFLIRHIKNL